MKIFYKHIVDHINDKPDKRDLSEKLFQLGHEHEIDGDIFDFELTPNRGDCLSTKGLLRDLNLFYEVNSIKPIFSKDIEHFDYKFSNKAQDACPKISFLKIDIETIPDIYNEELESYFLNLSIKKNNFFTDISNYISYETGQPTHCYKAEEVENGLTLDFLDKKQQFKTLFDTKIQIDPGNLVFLNHKNDLVNFAGIVGGKSSACDQDTKTVIVECAYFNPEVILGKATKYSINSDAAHKFERNVDLNSHEYVLRRFLQVVEQHTKILNVQLYSNTYKQSPQTVIDFDLDRIINIIGKNIEEKDCIAYLQRLGFVIKQKLIYVPSYRNDIANINDIAEEIARAIGYDNIEPKKFIIDKPKIKSHDDAVSQKNSIENRFKNLLIDNGFCEVINDPFTFQNIKSSIEVDNPLDSNRKFLRTNLKNSLLDNLLYNERRQHDSIKLFEISDVYSGKSNMSKKLLGIIISGRVDKNYIDFNKKLNKKYLVDILNKFIDRADDLNYEVISRDGINSRTKSTITYVEMELDANTKINYVSNDNENKIFDLNIKYTPISNYPLSVRDLSFSIKDFSKCELLDNYLTGIDNDLLKEVFIFDHYLNEKNNEIKIGYRFVFQSKETTITEGDVNKIINPIIEYSKSMSGVTIPGFE